MVGPISTICFDAPRPNQGDVDEALCKFCSDPYNLENSLLCEDPAYFIMGRCSQKYMDVVGEYGWTCPTELAKYHLELYNPGSDQDETVRKLTAIIPKFFCVASFFGSAYIVWELYKHRNQKLRLAFNRLLLVLSIFDMISSFAFFFGDWAIPETAPPIYYDCSGSPWDPAYGWPNKNHSNHLYGSNVINGCIWANYYDSYFLYSSGTQGTCTLQGTLIQIGALGSVLATGATALTCMLTVRYDWREKRLRQFEKMFFPFLIIFPIGSAIYLAFAGYFNPTAAGFCYISPYPWDLWWPFVVTQTPSPSYRGIDHWEIFQVIFAQLWVALVLLIILVSMGSVYLHVANQERRSNRWTIDSPSIIQSETRRQSSTRRGPGHRSQLVLEKGMMYIGRWMCLVASSILLIRHLLTDSSTNFFLQAPISLCIFLS